MSDASKFGGPIRIGSLAADPSNPEVGLIYYNSSVQEYRWYNGSAFVKISDANSADFFTDVFRIKDDSDDTKQIAFDASAIATGTTRTISTPDADVDLKKVNYIESDGTNTGLIGETGGGVYVTSDQWIGINSGNSQNIFLNADGGAILFPNGRSTPDMEIKIINNADNDASNAGNLAINGSDKTDGTGNGGSVSVRPGSSVGGTPGTINLNDLNLGSRSIGDVWTLTDTSTGAGEWSTPSGGGGTEFSDSDFRVQDNADATKELAFEVSAITTGTTRTITMPDDDVNLGALNNNNIANDGISGAKVRLDNNQWLRGRNAANDADINIVKIHTDDSIRIGVNPNIRINADGSMRVDSTDTLDISGENNVTLSSNTGNVDVTAEEVNANGNYVNINGTTGANMSAASVSISTTDASENGILIAPDNGVVSFDQSGKTSIDATINSYASSNDDADAVDAGNLTLEAQSKNAGTGNGGNLIAKPGTSVGGNAGTFNIEDASLAGSSAGYVWTLTNPTTGAGQWSANDGAGIASVSEDTTPQLGGDLDVSGFAVEDSDANLLLAGQNSVRRAKQASKANYIEEEYIHAISLLASQTDTVIAALTFAHASVDACEIVCKLKEATTGNTSLHTLRVVSDGTTAVITEEKAETASAGVTFTAAVNGANVEIRYSSGSNAVTMRADVKRFLV